MPIFPWSAAPSEVPNKKTFTEPKPSITKKVPPPQAVEETVKPLAKKRYQQLPYNYCPVSPFVTEKIDISDPNGEQLPMNAKATDECFSPYGRRPAPARVRPGAITTQPLHDNRHTTLEKCYFFDFAENNREALQRLESTREAERADRKRGMQFASLTIRSPNNVLRDDNAGQQRQLRLQHNERPQEESLWQRMAAAHGGNIQSNKFWDPCDISTGAPIRSLGEDPYDTAKQRKSTRPWKEKDDSGDERESVDASNTTESELLRKVSLLRDADSITQVLSSRPPDDDDTRRRINNVEAVTPTKRNFHRVSTQRASDNSTIAVEPIPADMMSLVIPASLLTVRGVPINGDLVELSKYVSRPQVEAIEKLVQTRTYFVHCTFEPEKGTFSMIERYVGVEMLLSRPKQIGSLGHGFQGGDESPSKEEPRELAYLTTRISKSSQSVSSRVALRDLVDVTIGCGFCKPLALYLRAEEDLPRAASLGLKPGEDAMFRAKTDAYFQHNFPKMKLPLPDTPVHDAEHFDKAMDTFCNNLEEKFPFLLGPPASYATRKVFPSHHVIGLWFWNPQTQEGKVEFFVVHDEHEGVAWVEGFRALLALNDIRPASKPPLTAPIDIRTSRSRSPLAERPPDERKQSAKEFVERAKRRILGEAAEELPLESRKRLCRAFVLEGIRPKSTASKLAKALLTS